MENPIPGAFDDKQLFGDNDSTIKSSLESYLYESNFVKSEDLLQTGTFIDLLSSHQGGLKETISSETYSFNLHDIPTLGSEDTETLESFHDFLQQEGIGTNLNTVRNEFATDFLQPTHHSEEGTMNGYTYVEVLPDSLPVITPVKSQSSTENLQPQIKLEDLQPYYRLEDYYHIETTNVLNTQGNENQSTTGYHNIEGLGNIDEPTNSSYFQQENPSNNASKPENALNFDFNEFVDNSPDVGSNRQGATDDSFVGTDDPSYNPYNDYSRRKVLTRKRGTKPKKKPMAQLFPPPSPPNSQSIDELALNLHRSQAHIEQQIALNQEIFFNLQNSHFQLGNDTVTIYKRFFKLYMWIPLAKVLGSDMIDDSILDKTFDWFYKEIQTTPVDQDRLFNLRKYFETEFINYWSSHSPFTGQNPRIRLEMLDGFNATGLEIIKGLEFEKKLAKYSTNQTSVPNTSAAAQVYGTSSYVDNWTTQLNIIIQPNCDIIPEDILMTRIVQPLQPGLTELQGGGKKRPSCNLGTFTRKKPSRLTPTLQDCFSNNRFLLHIEAVEAFQLKKLGSIWLEYIPDVVIPQRFPINDLRYKKYPDPFFNRFRYIRGHKENIENYLIHGQHGRDDTQKVIINNVQFVKTDKYSPEFQLIRVKNGTVFPDKLGLCPYCPTPIFYDMKTSEYSQHLTRSHGILTNRVIPNPLMHGTYQLKKRTSINFRLREGVVCPHCHELVEIRCNQSTKGEPFLSYFEHFAKHR